MSTRPAGWNQLIWAVLAVPFLIFGVGGQLLHGAPLETFEGAPEVMKENGAHEQTECEIVEDGKKSKNKAFKLSWSEHQGTHAGGNLVYPNAVLLERSGHIVISARVNLEEAGPECRNIALRFIDSKGEVYQVRVPVPVGKAGEPGWSEISWELDTEHYDVEMNPPWGGEPNAIIDLPIRLLGFAVTFTDHQTKGGALLLDDIKVTDGAAP